jgi:hypothetical protein
MFQGSHLENSTSISWNLGVFVGWLRQRDRAPKLSGSKFIKQAGSDSEDLRPKAEPQEQRGPSLLEQVTEMGVRLVPYMVTYYFIGYFNPGRGGPSLVLLQVLLGLPQIHFLFARFTVALIISHYLPSPSLPFCHRRCEAGSLFLLEKPSRWASVAEQRGGRSRKATTWRAVGEVGMSCSGARGAPRREAEF